MKYLNSFLLFFTVLFCFAQKTNEKDTLSLKLLEKQKEHLWDSLYKIPLNKTKKNTYHLITLIEKKKSSINKKNSNVVAKVDDLYLEILFFLMESIHSTERQYDSIIYYNSYAKKFKSTNNHLLGKIERITGYANYQSLNFVDAIKHYHNALDYFHKSKNPLSKIYEIRTLNAMANFYIFINSFSNAEEILTIIETKIPDVDEEFQTSAKLMFTVGKSKLLAKKNKKKEALALLKEINEKDLIHPDQLSYYYSEIMQSYLDNEMPDMAMMYYQKFFGTKALEIYDTPAMSIIKHRLLGTIYLQKGELKKAEFHINQVKHISGKIHLENLFTNYYNKTGDFKKAYIHLKKANKLKDSINTSNTKIISDIIAYNLTRDTKLTQLKEINELKDKAARKEKELYFLILISVILFSLFFIGWVYTNRRKKRLKLELELQKSKEIIAAKNNFLENVSHEIRTPITIITGYLSLIKEHTLEPQKVVRYSDAALLNTERMMGTFNDFLTLFRLEKKPTYLHNVSAKNPNLYIKELVSSFKANCELKNISLYYKSNIQEKNLIEYDYEALKKIVHNLVSNAIKYSNMNTAVYVSSLLKTDSLHVLVKDQGIGIEKKEQDAIFERFYQSKRHIITDGFGIGLSLVFELVKKMNGTITLESEENVGSVFEVILPLQLNKHALYVKDQKTVFEKLTEPIVKHKVEANNRPKALIVDDNLELISYLKEVFSSSLDCTFASNGDEGLAFAIKNKFDIIISDYRMPIMDGIEFKAQINKLKNYNEIPFVMITATPFEALSDLKITLGFDDYIVKPFTKNEIITRVQTLLEKNIYRKKMITKEGAEINFEGSYSNLSKKMNTIIHKNLNNPEFNVKLLASECGYSQKQLSRIVQSKTGMSLVNIILEVRLLKAYELILKDSYPTLNEVMFAVGINSRTYFGKKFKERFGIKPNELKNNKPDFISPSNS